MVIRWTSRRRLLSAAALTAAFAVPSGASLAAPGDLDGSFDGDGIRPISYSDQESATGLALEPGGKIIVLGDIGSDMTVTRLLPGGAFDTTFSGDGRRTIDLGDEESASSIARQGNKYLIAGASGEAAVLFRLTKRGGFDKGFSGDGRVRFTRPGSDLDPWFNAVAGTPDGEIVAVGYMGGPSGLQVALVVRYTASGRLDRSFSKDGIRTIASPVDVIATDVIVRADGKILVLLYGDEQDNGVVRLKPNGKTDRTYGGGDGVASLPGDWSPFAMARDGERVVVAAHDVPRVIHVARLSPDGRRTTFAGDGIADIDDPAIGPTDVRDVAVQADSRIVVAADNGNQQVIRLTAGGALDTSFNGGLGFVEVGGAENSDGLAAIRVDSLGRIVAAGRLGLDGADPSDQVIYRIKSQ